MSGAYTLYVNLMANTGGLTTGLRGAAGQLRSFDSGLAGVGTRLGSVRTATEALTRAQAAASAEAIRSQTRMTQAAERAAAAQQVVTRAHRAQALAASLATRAQEAHTAATLAGERAARAQALAQTMASRAQATAGAGAAAAARTAAAAQVAADRVAQAHTAAQTRAATAQLAATRASGLAQRASTGLAEAENRALTAVTARDQAQRAAARTAQASAQQIAAAESRLAAASSARASAFAQGGLVIGAALGVGVANAIQLERAMANVMTISQQITSQNVAAFTDEIVRLSTELPQTAEQLAEGLYQIVSTGFDGSEAMSILNVAAQGASAGLTTTETSARALLGVLKAYGLPASAATDVMDTMFQTVNLGVVSFEELAQQLGDVVPMAAAAGVEFDDLSSALAAITLAGIPAAEAATALNMMMTRMVKPTREMRDAIKDLGYESVASAIAQDGLYVVVNKLREVTGGSADAIASMFKDIRATRAMLALSAADGKNYADTYKGIAIEVARAGAAEKAYAIQLDTTAGQWALFRNQATALGIDLGRALLPALQTIGEYFKILAGAINDLPGPVKSLIGGFLALAAAGLLLRAAVEKASVQLAAFRTNLAAARAGGSALPAVLSGAGLAVTGLAALVTLGVAAYAAYSASKQQAKAATQELVEAMRAERTEGEQGAGLRKLTEQLTSSGDLEKLREAGVTAEQAIDAIINGGQRYKDVLLQLQAAKQATAKEVGKAVTYDESFDHARGVLERQHQMWGDAVKKEAELAANMAIVNAKIKNSRIELAGAWDLTAMLPVDKNGAPKFTDEMQAMGKALADIVDPAKAWKAAQDEVAEANRKAGRSADSAKASLADYMEQLRKQLSAQRDWQKNLGALAASGRLELVDHFAKLGVDAAPMLDELVRQLDKGGGKVADELEAIIQEGASRSTPAFRAGLEQLPGIAAKYGKEIAQAWADASATNNPGKLAQVMQRMALADMGRAASKLPQDARATMQQGMKVLAETAARGGKDAAEAMKTALLSGDLEGVRTQLQAVFGADMPISPPDLSRVVAAFQLAGGQANTEWSGALTLIQMTAATKGTAAAQALTSALLSGDMAAVKANLDAIGMSVQNIPGSKSISVNVSAPPPPPVVISILYRRTPMPNDKDGNGISDYIQAPQANGSVLSFYANGGVREQHVAQIAPPGAWRVWAEPETQGEAYVPLAGSKRPRSKAIVEEVVHRFGGEVAWYANGGLSGWSYRPGTAELSSLSSIRTDSMRKVKKGGKESEIFDLDLFERNLDKAASKAAAWRRDLATVARRAGQDVADALQDMEEDGVELTKRMANGSSKYIKDMTDDLQALGKVARASLGAFTTQLKSAIENQEAFEGNLAKIAAWGYTDLATLLAEQGDKAAETVAAEAARSQGAARDANDVSKRAKEVVSGDALTDLIQIIGAIRSSGTGIHDVADATKLDEDRIIEVALLGQARIQQVLGGTAAKFLEDLARAKRGLSYANGGILTPGVYATSNGIVRFAEPALGGAGEAFIPLGASKRGPAQRVLADVAGRFGYQLGRAGVNSPRVVEARPEGRTVVVLRDERPTPLIGTQNIRIDRPGATEQQISAAVGYQLRRAKRGGIR
ncbi:phage tail tape measure protein [Streptomyces goshikiensis]|uniref:phage tail tape measure protein n=1 Tax=Streptomyces goshikiensis TaxID=1942 RepID=UPI0036DA7852